MLPETFDRFASVRSFRDQNHVGLPFDDGRDTFAKKRMIIDDKHSNRVHCIHRMSRHDVCGMA
jgi:hypothetical protein